MTTRTTGKRETLEERCDKRSPHKGGMMDLKIEYGVLHDEQKWPDEVPVVRLAEVERLIQEAEKIIKQFQNATGVISLSSASVSGDAFLASIAAWRTGQEGERKVEG